MQELSSLLICLLVATITSFTGCDNDDGWTFDTYSDQAMCAGGTFAKRTDDGPCDRCRTEAGMIMTGRDGQLCYNPFLYKKGFEWHKMVLFGSKPLEWWPSDTLFMSGQTWNDSTFTGGRFSVLGTNADRSHWTGPACPSSSRERDAGGYWPEYLNPTFGDLTSSDGDADIENGEDFSFVVQGPDVNNDCFEDWGYTTGYMRNDTAFAKIVWKVMNWPYHLAGDTLLISDIIIVEAPEWAQPKG